MRRSQRCALFPVHMIRTDGLDVPTLVENNPSRARFRYRVVSMHQQHVQPTGQRKEEKRPLPRARPLSRCLEVIALSVYNVNRNCVMISAI